MVRRNDGAVAATLIGGELVFDGAAFVEGFGQGRRYGSFLRAGVSTPAPTAAAPDLTRGAAE
jgi:hypothetical protein